MKTVALIILMALIPMAALADGPDGRTLSVSTSGAALVVNANPGSIGNKTPQNLIYVTCANSGFTFSAWRYYAATSTWARVVFTGLANPDTAHVVAGLTVPIEGKYDLIWFDMDVGTENIDMLAYTE